MYYEESSAKESMVVDSLVEDEGEVRWSSSLHVEPVYRGRGTGSSPSPPPPHNSKTITKVK